jgi:hypothetical protein
MYVILTLHFYVLNVHRTTYKRLNSYLLIEKSTLQFDRLTSWEKVSSLCISPIISYKNKVTLIIIINHWHLTILVSQLLPLQTLRFVVFCQIFHLLRDRRCRMPPSYRDSKSFLYIKFTYFVQVKAKN